MSRAGTAAKIAASKAAAGVAAKVGISAAGVLLPFAGIIGIVGLILLVVVIGATTITNNQSDPEAGGVHCAAPDSDDDDDDSETPTAPEAEVPSEYQDDVASAAETAGVPEEMIAAQIYHESGWRDDVQSHVGARGLAQFMPDTWRDEWGDIDDPHDSIAAQGEYMAEIRDSMEDHADNEEHLWELMLAGYNAGTGAVQSFDYDLDAMFSHGSEDDTNSYAAQTGPYVANITAAAEGASGANCSVPQGDLVDTTMHLAWEEEVTLPHSTADDHGKDDSKDEYVETAADIHEAFTHAFYTDCGAFVATAVRASGTDPNFALRGTDMIEQYVEESDEWETFTLENEGQLQAGDVFIATHGGGGHTYIYTDERPDGDAEAGTHRAQGASLYTRPPSGHYVSTTLNGQPYTIARHVGSDNDSADEEED